MKKEFTLLNSKYDVNTSTSWSFVTNTPLHFGYFYIKLIFILNFTSRTYTTSNKCVKVRSLITAIIALFRNWIILLLKLWYWELTRLNAPGLENILTNFASAFSSVTALKFSSQRWPASVRNKQQRSSNAPREHITQSWEHT